MGCAFGVKNSNVTVKQFKDGQEVQEPIGTCIKQVLIGIIDKVFCWEFLIHPATILLYLTKKEREQLTNIKLLR